MIDEKKLIEEFQSKYCDSDFMDSGVIQLFVEEINKQPKVGEWIPCSERLPEEKEGDFYPLMYVTTKYGEVFWGFYRVEDKQWYLYNYEVEIEVAVKDGCVIAWQEPPEPYKGE